MKKLSSHLPLFGPIMVEDTKMYLHTKDHIISDPIAKGEYEKLETILIKRIIKEGMIVCDIGAHIGYYSLLFSKLVKKNGKVISFEPDPTNFQILKKNKSINRLQNLILTRIAVSNITGETRLFLCSTNSGDHRIYKVGDERNSITVKVTTIDDYFKEFNKKIDLIKMDIQGSEMKALEGMINCIKNNSNMKILTEFWPYGLRQAGSEPKEFIDLLDRLGFKIFNINEEKFKLKPFLEDKFLRQNKKEQFTNLLCIRRSSSLPQILTEIERKKNKKITSFRQLKESYEKLWKEEDLREENFYYQWIISLLGKVKGKKLLDIGCGAGYLLENAVENDMDTTGIDISQNALKKAEKRAPKAKIIEGVAEYLPFKSKSFDIVTCLGSLEHFLNPKKALNEMTRVIKDDSLLCIVLPNRWALDVILTGVTKGVEMSHGQELERFYTLGEAMNLLTKNGFRIERIFGYNKSNPTDIQTGTKFSTFANLIYKNIYRFIRKHIPIRLSYVFIFILKKNDISN